MRSIILSLIIIGLFFVTSCTNNNQQRENNRAKYVFYFIGDGMSLPQLSLTEGYLAQLEEKTGMHQLNQSKMDAHGWFYTHAENRFVTGSAAAGTALATGQKTSIGTIGKNANHSENLESIARKAKNAGLKVGIISSVSINHATPAVFYAHANKRKEYYKIGQQLFTSEFDLFAGGGLHHAYGKNDDQPNLYETKADYNIIRNNKAFLQTTKSELPLYFVHERLVEEASMPYAIDMNDSDLPLAEITRKSIELLDNENGFFMMVEGGKIDWACHANDAATVIHDLIDFDNAIGYAMEFALKHPDETLIVVLGDHETGGLSLGNKAMRYETNFALLHNQKKSFDALVETIKPLIENKSTFEQALEFVKTELGLGVSIPLSENDKQKLQKSWETSVNYKNSDVEFLYGSVQQYLLTAMQMLNEKAGIGWTTNSHTGIPVVMHAHGVGSEQFDGILDNTDIPKRIFEAIQGK